MWQLASGEFLLPGVKYISEQPKLIMFLSTLTSEAYVRNKLLTVLCPFYEWSFGHIGKWHSCLQGQSSFSSFWEALLPWLSGKGTLTTEQGRQEQKEYYFCSKSLGWVMYDMKNSKHSTELVPLGKCAPHSPGEARGVWRRGQLTALHAHSKSPLAAPELRSSYKAHSPCEDAPHMGGCEPHYCLPTPVMPWALMLWKGFIISTSDPLKGATFSHMKRQSIFVSHQPLKFCWWLLLTGLSLWWCLAPETASLGRLTLPFC